MAAVYILIIVLAVFALILLIPVRVDIFLNMDEQKVTLRYAFFRFVLYPRQEQKKNKNKGISDEKVSRSGKNFDIYIVLEILKESKNDIKAVIVKSARYFARHGVKIREMNFSAKFGTGDPAYTGVLCGAAYTTVYNAVGYLDRHTRLVKWSVDMSPDFDNACFSAGIYMQLSTNAAHFIIMFCGIIKYVLEISKNILKIKKQTDLRKE